MTKPIVRPLFSRGKAFHYDPAWLEPRRRADIERTQRPGELALLDLMEAAKSGYPEQLSEVILLLKQYEDDSFWGRASLLLSYAAPSLVLQELVERFHDEIHIQKDVVIQCFIAETLLNSGMLWTVPAAVAIMKSQVDRERVFSIPSRLSSILEAKPGDVFFGPEEVLEPSDLPEWLDRPFHHDDVGYENIVREVYDARLAEVGGNAAKALFLGRSIDLRQLAYDLLMNIGRVEDNDEVARIRTILEAQTGIDLSAFFREDLVLDRYGAMQALERMFDTVDFDRFVSGQRYFFGRALL
jgi:hypothetical protein